jgi:hypothetical protein
MLFVDFSLASVAVLVSGVLKWLLMGRLVAASRIWHHAVYAVPLGLGVLLVGLGMLFRVTHWDFATELLLSGAATVALSYGLWFRAIISFVLLDFFKLTWALSATATFVCLAVFGQLTKPLAGVTEALFWAMALLFVYGRWIRREPASPLP